MKKNLLVLFFAIIVKLSLAQGGWLEIGAKGGYGFNFLVNKNFYSDHNFSPNCHSVICLVVKLGLISMNRIQLL